MCKTHKVALWVIIIGGILLVLATLEMPLHWVKVAAAVFGFLFIFTLAMAYRYVAESMGRMKKQAELITTLEAMSGFDEDQLRMYTETPHDGWVMGYNDTDVWIKTEAGGQWKMTRKKKA